MIEIIPKPTRRLPEWQNILFYLSLALLTAAVLSYILLIYFVSKSTTTLQDLESQIAQTGTAEEKALEKEVFGDEKRINDFAVLLSLHQKPSNFFTLLENITHPKVWFSKLTLDLANCQAILSGQAPNFSILGQQSLILQNEEAIESIDLTELSLGKEGQAEFTLSLVLDPTILK